MSYTVEQFIDAVEDIKALLNFTNQLCDVLGFSECALDKIIDRFYEHLLDNCGLSDYDIPDDFPLDQYIYGDVNDREELKKIYEDICTCSWEADDTESGMWGE